MQSKLPIFRALRYVLPLFLIVPCGAAMSKAGPSTANLIPNGDFSKGNTGFTSELPYVKPSYNCIWEGVYTIAPSFNNPQLHKLIAPESYQPVIKSTGNEKVLFANAGGTEALMMWSTEVKCQPNTRYLLSFNVMSMTGYMVDGNPPHQVATPEWASDFEIRANDEASIPVQAGLGKYARCSMLWDSRKATSAILRIVRDKFPHGGAIIGISDIEMISKGPTPSAKR